MPGRGQTRKMRKARKLAAVAALAIASPGLAEPRFTVVDPLAGGGPGDRRALADALDSGKIETIPTWTGAFPIKDKRYRFRLVGRPPDSSLTRIQVELVAIRLTVPDGPGGKTIVFDATGIMDHIVASPLFSASPTYDGAEFGDAMLRAEFPDSNPGWRTILEPVAGGEIAVAAPPGTVKIKQAKSGKYFGFIKDSSIVNKPIAAYLKAHGSHDRISAFITYNSVEKFAYGYHSWKWADRKKRAIDVYLYSSWMEGIDDVLGFPSPDAATLSHEIAETLHDPLIDSVTRKWGDPFRKNRCFQRLIEVADAVEFAGLRKLYAKAKGMVDGQPFDFTVQNAALLPWFAREDPSSALDGAYSFPTVGILTKPAPMHCVKRP